MFTPPVPRDFVEYGDRLAEPRDPQFFQGRRIYSRKILGTCLLVTITDDDSVCDQQVYITKPKEAWPSAEWIGAILASKLIGFFIRGYYDERDDAFPQIKVGQLKSLPIASVDPSKPEEVTRHDRVVEMVQVKLAANRQLCEDGSTLSPQERAVLQRRVTATDRRIDHLVYTLYGLTPEEIALVEAATET